MSKKKRKPPTEMTVDQVRRLVARARRDLAVAQDRETIARLLALPAAKAESVPSPEA